MQGNTMEQWRRSGHISGGNASYVEDLYESYLDNPASVPCLLYTSDAADE